MKNRQSTKRMTITKLRRKLSGYGIRGQALNAMIRLIVAGPAETPYQGEPVYVYGWTRPQMNRSMRRALVGKSGTAFLLVDCCVEAAAPVVRRRSVICINPRYLA